MPEPGTRPVVHAEDRQAAGPVGDQHQRGLPDDVHLPTRSQLELVGLVTGLLGGVREQAVAAAVQRLQRRVPDADALGIPEQTRGRA